MDKNNEIMIENSILAINVLIIILESDIDLTKISDSMIQEKVKDEGIFTNINEKFFCTCMKAKKIENELKSKKNDLNEETILYADEAKDIVTEILEKKNILCNTY